jgi:DNA-binding beta-propeller fold protein YncE
VRRALVCVAAACGLLACAAAAPAAPARPLYDVQVFARVPSPGSPEPVVVAPDRTVYVGTNQAGKGSDADAAAPSRVFAFSPAGKLLRSYVLKGQPLGQDHGIQGIAQDGDGLLYLLDRSADPRVVVLDPVTGAQRRYASFRDVPACSAAGRTTDCSATVNDAAAGPDYATFAPDGTLYVTDIDQALIWRVKRGGGKAEVWFTDPRLESVFGPNGIQFLPGGRTLLFVNTGSNPQAGNPATGRLYRLPLKPDGRPGTLTQLWESRPLDGPDGFAIGRSGRVYLALAGASQMVVLTQAGDELARFPATPLQNQQQEIPFNGPASVAFDGRRLLVTNQGFPEGTPDTWAVLDVWAGETGLPLFRPFVRAPRPRKKPLPRLRLTVRPKRAVVGRPTRFRFRVRLHGKPVRGALVRFTGRRARSGRHGRASFRFRPRHGGLRHPVATRRGALPGGARVRFVHPARR